MDFAIIALAAFALTAPTRSVPATFNPAPDEAAPADEFIMWASANPATCNQSNARPVSFSAFQSQSSVLKGTCVAVTGYWNGALFSDVRAARAPKAIVSDKLRARRIGLYARPEVFASAPANPERYLIVGLAGDCETQWPGAMMVMGYCHYSGGPILLVSQVIRSPG